MPADSSLDLTVPASNWVGRHFMVSPVLLCIAGTDGYFKQVNPTFQKMLGHTDAILLAQPFIEFVHPDDQQATLDEVRKLSNGIPAVHFENRYRHADGSYRWLLWNTTPMPDEGLLYATAIDITERRQADERYRNLLNAVPDAIIYIDKQGKILNMNPATESLFGYDDEELAGQSIEVLVPPRFRDQHRQHRDGFAKDPQPRLLGDENVELSGIRKDGSEFPVEICLGPVEGQHIICVVRDISQRKRRENELEKSRQMLVEDQRQLQRLSIRLVLAEECERRRIACGLHDDVGQTLLTAKLSLEELLESGLPDDTESSARDIRCLVDNAIAATRTLSFELASAVLYEVGVGAALQSECELAKKQGGIQFQPPEELKDNAIPMKTKVILYRVGRELIRNVVKHSNARTAKLSLALNGDALHLTVEDDGRGFDASKGFRSSDPTGGFGLFSIDQQLDSIGGTLKITSTPVSGTRAVVYVNLNTGQTRV